MVRELTVPSTPVIATKGGVRVTEAVGWVRCPGQVEGFNPAALRDLPPARTGETTTGEHDRLEVDTSISPAL